MHTEQQIRDIGLLSKGLQLLNIDVSLRPAGRLRYPVACRYVNHPDGSLRWIWPAGARGPQFLRFHHAARRGDKRRTAIVRAAFALRLPALVSSGKCIIYTSAIGERCLRGLTDWAICTGEAGPNRRLTVWHTDAAGDTGFTSLSLSIAAAKNVYAERNAILQPAPEGIVMPETVHTRCLAFTQTELFKDKAGRPVGAFEELPLAPVQRWLGGAIYRQRMCDAGWYR